VTSSTDGRTHLSSRSTIEATALQRGAVVSEIAVQIPDVAERKGISGAVVNVRLGVVLAVVALAAAVGLLLTVVAGSWLWLGALLAVVSLGLSGYSAYLGIYGVIRYGLFTEGCGAAEVAGELHESRIAYIAGILSQITLLFAGALTIALIVRAVL
jgi:hypothetical protein